MQSNSNLNQVVNLTAKLREARETCRRFFGREWPEVSEPWKKVIAAKAEKERKSNLLSAMELAKEAPNGMTKLIIMASAVDMPSKWAGK